MFIIFIIFIINRKFSKSIILDLCNSETKFMYLNLNTISPKRLKFSLFKTEVVSPQISKEHKDKNCEKSLTP